MESKSILIVICLVALAALVGCTTIHKMNPLSRSHGLPAQYESEED